MGNSKSRLNETKEQRRARLQREYGILMPPSFVNGTKLPISNQAALQASQAVTPSILDYLWETNPGTRLLQEYLQPGIAMRIPTTTGSVASGEILVGLQPIPKQERVGDTTKSPTSTTTTPTGTTTTTSSSSAPPPPSSSSSLDPLMTPPNQNNKLHHTSSIIATHYYDPLQIRVHVPTHRAPSIQISSKGSNVSFSTRIPLAAVPAAGSTTKDPTENAIAMDTGGWMELRYKRNALWKGQVDFVASTWMTMDSLQDLVKQSMTTTNANTSTTSSAATNSTTPLSRPTVQFQAGLEYQESIVAAQTSIPLTKDVLAGNLMSELPKIETMVSINLNHRPNTSSNKSDTNYFGTNHHDSNNDNDDYDDNDTTTQVAPLWLSLKHTSSSAWVLNLSQILTFDRPVLNPLDERAPNIRQTLGWVVQVEKEPFQQPSSLFQHQQDNVASSHNNAKTSWSAGATFQLNRNTACKAVLIEGHTLLYGAILKRWSQPRITLSLFHSLHIPTGQHGHWGFGLELETATPMTGDPGSSVPMNPTTSSDDGTEYPPPHPHVSPHHQGPPTKIRIPKAKMSHGS